MIGTKLLSSKLLAAFILAGTAVGAFAEETKPLPADKHPQPAAAAGSAGAANTWTTKEVPATTKKPAVAATPSPCKGLDATACSANKACSWVVPKDPNDATGKVQEPYCRKSGGSAAAKPAAAKPAATAKTEAKPAATGNATAAAPAPAKAKVVAPAAPAGEAKVKAAAPTVTKPKAEAKPVEAPAPAPTTEPAATADPATVPMDAGQTHVTKRKAVPAAAGLVVVH